MAEICHSKSTFNIFCYDLINYSTEDTGLRKHLKTIYAVVQTPCCGEESEVRCQSADSYRLEVIVSKSKEKDQM